MDIFPLLKYCRKCYLKYDLCLNNTFFGSEKAAPAFTLPQWYFTIIRGYF